MLWKQLLETRYPGVKFSELTDAQKETIDGPEEKEGKVAWKVEKNFLLAKLPSGRSIRYRSPGLRIRESAWGKKSIELYYWSVNGLTRKYELTSTYGGKLVENIAQAFARDIIAHAMLRADKLRVGSEPKYRICFSVHDELVSEVKKGEGSAEEYEKLLCEIPFFAEGCSIAAEAEIASRYKK
jgi:DNA polymerase